MTVPQRGPPDEVKSGKRWQGGHTHGSVTTTCTLQWRDVSPEEVNTLLQHFLCALMPLLSGLASSCIPPASPSSRLTPHQIRPVVRQLPLTALHTHAWQLHVPAPATWPAFLHVATHLVTLYPDTLQPRLPSASSFRKSSSPQILP